MANTAMTEEMAKKYIDNNGTHCPFCPSTDIEGGFIEVQGKEAFQKMGCNICDEEWVDGYTRNSVSHGDTVFKPMLGEETASIFCTTITVIDPQTKEPVELEIHKDPVSGAMFGVDSSFLDQVRDSVPSMFNATHLIKLAEPDQEVQ